MLNNIIKLKNNKIKKIQDNLIVMFTDNDIPYIVFGAYITADWEKRDIEDIDLMIKKEDEKKVEVLMLQLGYKVANRWAFETKYQNGDGIDIEIRTNFYPIIADLNEIWDTIKIDGIVTLNPKVHLTYLVSHTLEKIKFKEFDLYYFDEMLNHVKKFREYIK